jgi:hypothetical protein
MKRRGFLSLVGLCLGGVAILPFRMWLKNGEQSSVCSFFVAGVRFNSMSGAVAAGDRVVIKRQSWHDEISYAIYIENGQRIGYVPRRFIPAVDNIEDHFWQMESVDHNSVPWKRYKITRMS